MMTFIKNKLYQIYHDTTSTCETRRGDLTIRVIGRNLKYILYGNWHQSFPSRYVQIKKSHEYFIKSNQVNLHGRAMLQPLIRGTGLTMLIFFMQISKIFQLIPHLRPWVKVMQKSSSTCPLDLHILCTTYLRFSTKWEVINCGGVSWWNEYLWKRFTWYC